MNFEDERYVRVYTRKTVTTKLIGWEGRATLHALLLEVDRAGVLDLEGEGPAEALTALSELPIEVTRVGMPRLIERGVVVVHGNQLVLPRFLDAQEARQSDAQRQRESRAKRSAISGLPESAVRAAASVGVDVTIRDRIASQDVTDCHTQSHDVTSGHSVLSCAQPYQHSSADQEHPSGVGVRTAPAAPAKSDPKRERSARWRKVPSTWAPNGEHRAIAESLRVDLDGEVAKFRDHEFKDPKSDPDATFRNWLRRAPAVRTTTQLGLVTQVRSRPVDASEANINRQFERVRMLEAEEARRKAQ